MTGLRFESHVTIDGRRRLQWVDHCVQLGVKQVAIGLDGDYPRQDMCTQRIDGTRSFANAYGAMLSLVDEIRRRGHVVIRQKLEVELGSLTGDARRHSRDAYYEAHIKLAVRLDLVGELLLVADSLGLAVSRSLLRPREGREKWFLTDRVAGTLTPESATAVFDESLTRVREVFPEAVMERELVLLDTCHAIDGGWKHADLGLLTR